MRQWSTTEFLREGAAIKDFTKPDRVVLGVESDRAKEVMANIYQPLSSNNVEVMMTGLETAELIKYAANAFLAVKISFINELADLCEKLGADIESTTTFNPKLDALYFGIKHQDEYDFSDDYKSEVKNIAMYSQR